MFQDNISNIKIAWLHWNGIDETKHYLDAIAHQDNERIIIFIEEDDRINILANVSLSLFQTLIEREYVVIDKLTES